tara:strand:- start:960 stop:1154 length:195 start_codon:yes stop_codon:yes gene_type:complete
MTTDISTLSTWELEAKRDGHHRIGESLRAKAYRAGKSSKEFALYTHHNKEWLRVNDEIRNRKNR